MKTICIAGKNDIAVDVLLYCIEHFQENRIICVTNKTETGKNAWQKSLKWFAEKNSVQICSLEDIYPIEDLVFVSTEFDKIIRPDKFASKQLFNIHFSLLPKFKGVYTSVLPILFDECETGVTLHKIERGIDTGDIIDQRHFGINYEDTSYDVYLKLISVGTKTVIDNLGQIIKGNYKLKKQDYFASTYFSPKTIDYSNLVLDVNCTAHQIHNQIRAFCFRPYQIITWNGKQYIESEITDNVSQHKPGTIIEENELYTIVSSIDYDIKMYKDLFDKLVQAINQKNTNRAKELCTCKKIIESKDVHGWSALTVSVYNNNLEMVEYLISKGADYRVKNNNGTTLLMYAKDVGLLTGDWTMIRYLSNLGLSFKERDYNDKDIKDYIKNEDLSNIPNDILIHIFEKD